MMVKNFTWSKVRLPCNSLNSRTKQHVKRQDVFHTWEDKGEMRRWMPETYRQRHHTPGRKPCFPQSPLWPCHQFHWQSDSALDLLPLDGIEMQEYQVFRNSEGLAHEALTFDACPNSLQEFHSTEEQNLCYTTQIWTCCRFAKWQTLQDDIEQRF